MSVKILIKRKVSDEQRADILPLLIKLRNYAANQPGYISGETLRRIDKPGESLVISTWQSADDWRKWVLSEERTEIQNKIDNTRGRDFQDRIYTNLEHANN